MSGNQAVDINQPNAAISINTNGSDWMWAAFSIFMLSDLGMIAWMFTRHSAQRCLHIVPIIALSIMSVVYFTMAADLGSTPVTAEFYGAHHQTYAGEPATRAIWYARYIGWVLTMPLLTLEVLFTAAMSPTEVATAMFFQVVAFVCFLVGALVSSTYKWGYFVFATVSIIYVIILLLVPGRNAAGAISDNVRSIFTRSTSVMAFLLLLYPLAWGLADGGNVITSDGEMVFYGVLDVLLYPCFLYAFVFQLQGTDVCCFGFGPKSHELISEKHTVAPTAAPVEAIAQPTPEEQV
ncbi:family A G protein-coupled receptor-like protein [Calocera cornea HHB12733]|uniref:Family A G protein-coupled receptor-like protein n=1 Tax=Calocera cornea HHB12733 TaxID=1353952 RepID=A0A165CJE7_9BASI|nr:family A G protein-coupled receptor-like protein [Calocera cornea HHB12733]